MICTEQFKLWFKVGRSDQVKIEAHSVETLLKHGLKGEIFRQFSERCLNLPLMFWQVDKVGKYMCYISNWWRGRQSQQGDKGKKKEIY